MCAPRDDQSHTHTHTHKLAEITCTTWKLLPIKFFQPLLQCETDMLRNPEDHWSPNSSSILKRLPLLLVLLGLNQGWVSPDFSLLPFKDIFYPKTIDSYTTLISRSFLNPCFVSLHIKQGIVLKGHWPIPSLFVSIMHFNSQAPSCFIPSYFLHWSMFI